AAKLASEELLAGESFNFGPKAEQNHTVLKLIGDMSIYWKFAEGQQPYQVTGSSAFAEAGLLKLNCDKALQRLAWLPTLEYGQMIEYVSSWYYAYYGGNVDMYGFTLDQIAAYEQAAADRGATWAS
ncbi:MAG: CDP-glucose 4,6-dehydratase, partial [Deltaproteobacteria bacterium]|nr:CDP-glucose 4,6-dehydratase [Deltaproteobacteria bacterium]